MSRRTPKAQRILSVSKDRELLFLRGEVLTSAGFQVVNATSVEEAIGALSDAVDLVLIGHTFSEDETVLIAKSAKDFSNGRIGVIVIRKMLSSWRVEPIIDECIDSMAKPEDLLDCVRSVLKRMSSP